MSDKGFGSLRTLSTLISRFALANGLGKQFSGERDLYAVFGWKKTLTYTDFYQKYIRQDVAKRVIDAPASATWRNPPEIKGPSKAWTNAWEHIVREHELWATIDRADRLAGIGQYAVLLLGFDDGGKLETPVNTSNKNKLIYLQPYSEPFAKISDYETDPTSPRFGLPLMYELTTVDPQSAALTQTQGVTKTKKIDEKANSYKVHYTRIVHIAEGLLDNNILGTPRLMHVYNVLEDLLKVTGGTSETFWMSGNRGMQFDIDKDAEITPDDAAALSDEIEEWQHQLRRAIKTKGVKVNPLGGSVPDPKNTFSMLISLLSGSTGIPQRILLGSEAGQLASDQDRANWADTIKERRTKFAQPQILIPLIDALTNAGALPEAKKEKLEFIWPPNFQLTPLEEAQSLAQKARAIINVSKHFESEPLINKEEARIMMGFDPVLPAGIEEFDPAKMEERLKKQKPAFGAPEDKGEDDPDEVSAKPKKEDKPKD